MATVASDQNVAVVEQWLRWMESGPDPGRAAEFYAPGSVTYGPAAKACPASKSGATVYDAFADLEFEVERIVPTRDRVLTYLSFRGRHVGAFEGNAPTGRPVAAEALVVHRLRDGRITEQWNWITWRNADPC